MMKLLRPFYLGFLSLLLLSLIIFDGVIDSQAQSDNDWSEPINLSNSGSAGRPLLVIDSNGVHHSIWIDDVDGYKYSYSVDGLTWSSPLVIDFPFEPEDSSPLLLPDFNGMIHIFWQSDIDPTDELDETTLNYTRFVGENFDSPNVWQTTQLAQAATAFDVHLDELGRLYIGYVRNLDSESNPSGIYYRLSLNNGISWSQGLLLYESEYLRSTLPGDAHISISTTDNDSQTNVYVAWDDKFQKGIYFTKSADGGLTWEQPKRFKGSEDVIGLASPYNVEIGSFENKVLVTWQTGEQGASRCTLYSQWSENGGEQWDEPIRMSDDIFVCPQTNNFISVEDDYFVVLLGRPTEFSLMAWDGAGWSRQQVQSDALSFNNPVTEDTIFLGCQDVSLNQNRLYIAGCDERRGGDVWFISRPFGVIEDWFSPRLDWGASEAIASTSQKISSLVSVEDNENNIHAFWSQSQSSVYDENGISLHYARWDGEHWLFDASIISGFSGLPVQLSPALDNQGRMYLVWVDADNGDLLFSWTYVDKANITTEWASPQRLPSPSQWNSAPDILVDAAGRIIIAYAVPLNEERGIYLTESTDSGESWSQPRKVFDSISADWDMVDQPEIILDGAGKLHMSFERYAISKMDQSKGLYYFHSSDGGITWSDVQTVSERLILWSDIISYNNDIVHLFWQEQEKSVIANRNQISRDGGMSWGDAFDVTEVNDQESQTILIIDRSGQLHFIQLVDIDIPELQDWGWDGNRWIHQSSIELDTKYHQGDFHLAAGVISDNQLNISLSIAYVDRGNEYKNEALSFSRYLGDAQESDVLLPEIVSTPTLQPNDILPSSTALVIESSPTDVPLANNPNGFSSQMIKNIIGLALVSIVLLIIVVVLKRRRS